MYRILFRFLCAGGRLIGGVRPRRMVQWVWMRAYGDDRSDRPKPRWHRNRWGCYLLLNPSHYLDYKILSEGCYDTSLHAFIERRVKPGMACLDVGANMGEVGLHMARKTGPTGAVHCFEPVPWLCERLRANIRKNALQETALAHGVALSDRTGNARLRLPGPDHPNLGMASLVSPSAQLADAVDVPTLTLDEFVAERRLERIDLIKVDIQGAEPLFLEGARGSLERHAPDLLMEISPEDLAGLGWDGRRLVEAVEQVGYEGYALSSRGHLGGRIRSRDISPDFRCSNVYFRNAARQRRSGSPRTP